MSAINQRNGISIEWLSGGVCGLLLASGLTIGNYVQSRHVVAVRTFERTSELRYQADTIKPVVQTASLQVVDWPHDLPKPLALPRPLDVSRFIDAPSEDPPHTELRLAELPEVESTQLK